MCCTQHGLAHLQRSLPQGISLVGLALVVEQNAALRAINLGYTKVLWYRGGVEARQQAGLPLQSSGQGAMQNN